MIDTMLSSASPGSDMLDFAAYRAAVSAAVVPLDIHTDRTDGFQGRLGTAAAGDIFVFDVQADQHSVHRTQRLVGHTPARYVKFTAVQRGSGLVIQDGRETTLGAGDMTVYDTDRPYSLLFDDAMRMTVVMFPKSLLPVPAEPFSRLTAVRFQGTAGVGGMVRQFLSSLGRQVGDLDGHIARRMHCTAVDMIGTLLEASVPTAPKAQDALLSRIHGYIDDNLGDQELDPARIARTHYISVRHLHALFNDQGTTVSTLIRTRRLERCYDDLVNPANGNRSVSAIALGNGFVDPAHFSRTFRTHFGVPPSSVRS